jgi:anti-sigma factor RsiW
MTMTCEQAEPLLHALLDNELDAGHAREIEQHVATCAQCAAKLASYSDLRNKVAGAKLKMPAPRALHVRIDRAIPAGNTMSRRAALKGFAAGSVMSAALAASLVLFVTRSDEDSRIAGEALSAHLRSLQAEHLTDVLSTDQHTVKPWFNGKLDVAPPVADLTTQGFTLIGGRLDYIDGKPVAAIVYRRRKHVINLFLWPNPHAVPEAAHGQSVQGFNLLRWSAHGLNLWAVSDLQSDELAEFKTRFEAEAQ